MKTQITDSQVKIWLSQRDTHLWADGQLENNNFKCWPCSMIAGERIFAEFDSNGLLDLRVNGEYPENALPSDEFNAITSDFLQTKLNSDHPLYFITVGQFNQ